MRASSRVVVSVASAALASLACSGGGSGGTSGDVTSISLSPSASPGVVPAVAARGPLGAGARAPLRAVDVAGVAAAGPVPDPDSSSSGAPW